VRRRAAGTETIATVGCFRDGLTEAPGGSTVRFEVGENKKGSIQLLVQPVDGVRAYAALNGIRLLLDAAKVLALRNTDKQRLSALWQPEAVIEEPGAVFSSPQTIELMQTARRIGGTSLPVLLVGDTGTGKEVLARAIHRSSTRAGKVFLPFNCSAVPRDMVESQLFGYRRGSFTGAAVDFPGIIRSAEGGTLFLDEIGELALDIQPKLLRFLETNEVHPLGEGRPVKVDVRVIAATNADLEDLIQRKLFREDLYYRLNIVRFQMPRLVERREEIPPLVLHLMKRYETEEGKQGIKVSDELMEYFVLYNWPGNVRQLSNELRKMVALVPNHETLTPDHLSPAIKATRRTVAADAVEPGQEAAPAAATSSLAISLDQPMPDAVEALERAMIEHAITRAEGRIEEAARLLGISRKGLFLKRRRWQKAGGSRSPSG
jgi:DNA-binding NtrC family response regulator